jgi:hypothetical protein
MALQNKLKAFVRFDGSGRVIPSSLILQKSKPKVGNWKEINATQCCDAAPTTTTTTTTAAPVYYYSADYYYDCNLDQSNVTVVSSVPLNNGSYYTDPTNSCVTFLITGSAPWDPSPYEVDANSGNVSCVPCT